MAKRRADGNVSVGDITGSQGVAVGHGAHATVRGRNTSGEVSVDARELRAALAALFQALGQADLPLDAKISAQTAAGRAIEEVRDGQVPGKTVGERVKQVGETLQGTNTVIAEGSALWQSIGKVAAVLGPLAGGASTVAKWFGLPVP